MSDVHTFGSRLCAARQRRGISLDTITSVTNVSVVLWQGLERNDFSRWPSGIMARSFVRHYARAIGLDEVEVVDEFCRLFPVGDRRRRRIIEAHARIMGLQPSLDADAGALPPEGDRRAVAPPTEPARARRPLAARVAAAAMDTAGVVLMTGLASYGLRIGVYETAAVLVVLYYGLATITLSGSPGSLAVAAIGHRLGSLVDRSGQHGSHA